MSDLVYRLRKKKEVIRYEAADRIDELEAALQFIADGYENHNINHVDYRVKVYQVALDALHK